MFYVYTHINNNNYKQSIIGPFETRKAAEQALIKVLGTVSGKDAVTGGYIKEEDDD